MTFSMFLPMSWISPLTVAMTIFPLLSCSAPLELSLSFIASKAFFKVYALCMSCGRNIRPASNCFPTSSSAGTRILFIISIASREDRSASVSA